MSTKNLKHYLENPDEMPTDPKEIERLANEHMAAAMELGNTQLDVDRIVGKPDEKPAEAAAPAADASDGDKAKAKETPKAEEKLEEKPKAEAKPDEKPAAKPEGVLAKDGKNVIPYAVLETARDRAVKAEQLAADQAKELEQLRKAKEKPEEPKSEMLTDEELTALEADSPTLAKLLRSQQATIQTLTGTVETIKGRVEQRDSAEAAEVKSEVQQAIDAVPELAGWQAAEDQTMFEKALAFDMVLRRLPEYRDVSFEDRFNRVVELTKAAVEPKGKAEAPKEEPQKPASTAEEIRAAAEAKLKEKSKAGVPKSLSDIPGGAPPAVDEKDRVEQMSAVELGNKFQSMTKDQLEAYLATL